ncbi:tetratricopeptide repeat protein [Alkalithermobacter paradoxus]|uniref:Tetratricopeptide repeat protein n=1 Tax=Alkalithermobacter paradoxus TaxID=29349 RepID=A0A1V4I6B7_9FIRM|nr:tetratricopeptide repeat protein [[Clostridium] thermoalcaliphilum]
MKRVLINRLIYLIIVSIMIFAVFEKKYYLILIPLLAWFIVERYFWKNFYQGKRLMSKLQYKSAADKFEAFLKDLEMKPWLNNLRFFNYGVYTHNLKAKSYNNIGICYLESRLFNKAEDYFKKSLDEDKDFCIPYYNLAIVELIKDNEEKAFENLKKSIKLGYNKVKMAQLKGFVIMNYKNGRK